MKKWKLKKMKESAAQLPQAEQMQKILGADMLRLYPNYVAKNFIEVDPKKFYMVPVPKNNYRVVKKLFKAGQHKKELNKFLAG